MKVLDLPFELVIHITLFIPLGCKDVAIFMCSCKSIQAILERDEYYHQLIMMNLGRSVLNKFIRGNESLKSFFRRYYPPGKRKGMMESAYDLFRRVPPRNREVDLSFVTELLDDDDQIEEILQTIDPPLKIGEDGEGRKFIVADYNRDGDSYRSPFDNNFYPPLEDGTKLIPELREYELLAQPLFERYVDAYYRKENDESETVVSCYCWESEPEEDSTSMGKEVEEEEEERDSFACSICIKKSISKPYHREWNSIHTITVNQTDQKENLYKFHIYSTFIVLFERKLTNEGESELSGDAFPTSINYEGSHLKQTEERNVRITSDENKKKGEIIVKMGSMIQEMENEMINTMSVDHGGVLKDAAKMINKENHRYIHFHRIGADPQLNALFNRKR